MMRWGEEAYVLAFRIGILLIKVDVSIKIKYQYVFRLTQCKQAAVCLCPIGDTRSHYKPQKQAAKGCT